MQKVLFYIEDWHWHYWSVLGLFIFIQLLSIFNIIFSRRYLFHVIDISNSFEYGYLKHCWMFLHIYWRYTPDTIQYIIFKLCMIYVPHYFILHLQIDSHPLKQHLLKTAVVLRLFTCLPSCLNAVNSFNYCMFGMIVSESHHFVIISCRRKPFKVIWNRIYYVFMLFQKDPTVRKEYLHTRAQLLNARYGSPAFSDGG